MFIVRTMQQNIIFPFLGGVLNKQTHAKNNQHKPTPLI